MSKLKYLVVPGPVASGKDHETHYIDAQTLMRLYKVNPKECAVLYSDERDNGKDFSGLIILHPRFDGKYEIPKSGEI